MDPLASCITPWFMLLSFQLLYLYNLDTRPLRLTSLLPYHITASLNTAHFSEGQQNDVCPYHINANLHTAHFSYSICKGQVPSTPSPSLFLMTFLTWRPAS